MKHQIGLVILVLQMLIVGMGLSRTGRFHAETTNDTLSYTEYPFHSVDSALRNMRTPGYPLFLKLVKTATGSYDAVPVLHFLVYCGAVLVVYWGLIAVVRSSVCAALIAGSLLTMNILWLYIQAIATDTFAAAIGLCAIGFVLRAGYSAQIRNWMLAGLVLSTTIAWLIRPAYLFLVPAVPVLVMLLRIRNATIEQLEFRGIVRSGLKLAMLVCLPVLFWCLIRFCMVNDFGVVAFGGYNFVGIAGQFLEPGQIEMLPSDLRPLARQAIYYRDQLPQDAIAMRDADPLNYLRIENNYDVTIWQIYSPAATDLYGDDASFANAQLKRIAAEIVWNSPRNYLIWLVKAFRHGVFKIVSDFVLNPFGLLLTLTVAVAAIGQLACGRQRGTDCPSNPLQHAAGTLFVAAFIYAAFSLILTILVCPPLGRMTDASAVLFMPFVMSVVLNEILDILNHRHRF